MIESGLKAAAEYTECLARCRRALSFTGAISQAEHLTAEGLAMKMPRCMVWPVYRRRLYARAPPSQHRYRRLCH